MQVVSAEEIVSRFHELYFRSSKRTWHNTYWLGRRASKCPLDLWVYQEILYERQPDVIVETGTRLGGSALFLATICDFLGKGRVITIDIHEAADRPSHPRIEYVTGSSTAPEILGAMRDSIAPEQRAMVILDSDHSRDHVLGEMRAYGPLVAPGEYLIVEDTHVNGNPIEPDFGPGPMEAVDDFLAEDDSFFIDESRHKFFMTFNPRGWLRKRQA